MLNKALLQVTKNELLKYSETINQSVISDQTYWIRKSKKVVLAMVCIQVVTPNSTNALPELKFVPGINIEVSIATGSICAERNAISTAFSMYPNLQKQDILCIAIGSFNLIDRKLYHIRPCCVCGAWLDKIWGKRWKANVISLSEIQKNNPLEESHSVNFQ